MNNAQRRQKARRERMDPATNVHMPRRADGLRVTVSMRYLVPTERRDFLRRATSPL